MDAFIASPGHYANIVDPEFTHIGVGVIRDPDNPARLFTTHRFMKLQNAPDPEPVSEPDPEVTEPPEEPAVEPDAPAPDEPAAADDPADADDDAATPDTDDTPAEAPAAPPPVTLERAEVVVRALSRMD